LSLIDGGDVGLKDIDDGDLAGVEDPVDVAPAQQQGIAGLQPQGSGHAPADEGGDRHRVGCQAGGGEAEDLLAGRDAPQKEVDHAAVGIGGGLGDQHRHDPACGGQFPRLRAEGRVGILQ